MRIILTLLLCFALQGCLGLGIASSMHQSKERYERYKLTTDDPMPLYDFSAIPKFVCDDRGGKCRDNPMYIK